ncbi:MAG TPA: universal stress protein [Pseudomonadales bacterium]|jgi:universal stress protein E
MSLYKKLFVVIDPTSKKQPALDRAIAIAQKSKGKLHLFLAIHKPVSELAEHASRKTGKQAELKKWNDVLKGYAEQCRSQGLTAKTDACWNDHWYQSVSRAAMRADADLVVKSTFRHGKAKRLLHSTSDWTIMRHSPAPVWLVRERKGFSGKSIVAALDLEARDEGHIRLNNSILKQARNLAALTDLPLHVVVATSKKPDFGHLLNDRDDSLEEALGIEAGRLHLVKGAPKNIIPKHAELLKADVVVIGTAARSGAKGVLIGNTAEKILDTLSADVLSVN